MNIAVSICVPSNQRKFDNWGDKYYAISLKNAFHKLDYDFDILYMDEWRKAINYDVLINIRGLKPYIPSAKIPVKILWQINHPELNTKEELNAYDKLFIASEFYTNFLTNNNFNASFLPQAGDDDYFLKPDVLKQFDVIFVGNNHLAQLGKKRQIVEDLLKQKFDFSFKIVGASWNGIVEKKYIYADFIEWKELPALYSAAKIVLNDHQETMKKYGFINNRTYDLAFLKQFQICDMVQGLDKFSIDSYESSEHLLDLINYYLENENERLRQEKIVYQLAKNENFLSRAIELLKCINMNIESKS